MVEAPSQVRDAIAQTRAELVDTLHALGEKVDATRHAVESISGEADHVLRAASQATAKVADLGQHAIGSAASQFKATTTKQRILVPILLAVGLLGIVGLLMAKRRREVVEDRPEWDDPDA
jgi:hypothetical protein